MRLIWAIWMAWVALWLIWSGGTKPVVRREPWHSRLLHLGPLGLAVLLLANPTHHPAALTGAILPRAAWMWPLGLGLLAAGQSFAIWARLTLAGNWSGTVTLKQDHELIRSGPYAVVRHPIYTGLILALAGTALAMDDWAALLGFLLVTVSFWWKSRTEEAFMRQAFGAAYLAYAARVPALVPFLRPRG